MRENLEEEQDQVRDHQTNWTFRNTQDLIGAPMGAEGAGDDCEHALHLLMVFLSAGKKPVSLLPSRRARMKNWGALGGSPSL